MKEERLPQTELDLYLKILRDSLADHGRLHPQIQLFGLPVEEWAGPGYAIGALFDPYVLTALLKPSTVYLEWPDADLPGISWIEKRVSQKEKISFQVNALRSPEFLLPMLWGGVGYQRFEATSYWQIQASVAECPALAGRDGAALFECHPLKVIHR